MYILLIFHLFYGIPKELNLVTNSRRRDLACEAGEDLENIEGTRLTRHCRGGYEIEIIEILTEDAARALGKKCGTYVTLSTPEIWAIDDSEAEELSKIIGDELRSIICSSLSINEITCDTSVLVVGLGNSMITADSIGPLTLEEIDVTRHIRLLDPSLFAKLEVCEISAIAPGVLGNTGLESAEMVKAACSRISPDVVIAIDALASSSIDRLARTFQFSDTGITPGAGIGNLRTELSRATLDVPVIAIGVPTVMDSSAVVFDALCRAGIENEVPDELIAHLERSERFYVTPKESDLMAERISHILALAISNALVINPPHHSYN